MMNGKEPHEVHVENAKTALSVFENFPRIGNVKIRAKYLKQLQEELKVLNLDNLLFPGSQNLQNSFFS